MDRRAFLKVSALAGGGFAIGFALPGTGKALAAESRKTFAPDQWIRITPDNVVTIVVDKSEMGQGVYTGLPMIVADELDADWSAIRIEAAPAAKEYAHPWFGVQGTGGSSSVRAMWEPLRKAGATARAMLVAAAAETWKVDLATLTTSAGTVIGPGGILLTYGQLADKAARMTPPKNVQLKDPATFKYVGKPLTRLDTPQKTNGSAQFGIDAMLPGLLTAVVARSPVVGGRLLRFRAEKARAVKGVKKVLAVKSPASEGVAVLATSYWAAKLGRDALEIEWDTGQNAALSTAGMREQMSRLAATGEGALTARKEIEPAAGAPAAKTVEAEYEVPYLVHAPMEPMNCTAWVKADGVEIWVGSQAQGPNQMTAAQIAGCKPEQVKIHTLLLGGGFGRRFAPDFLVEAVSLSKEAKGPVKVVYSREDDTRAYYYRPMAVAKLKGGLDAEGNPVSFEAVTVCDSLAEGTGFESMIIKDRVDRTSIEGLADIPYSIANIKVDWVKYQPGVRTWFLRSVGNTQNVFFSESFIDELAYAAGKDPYQFRRALLAQHPRHRAVLELAAEKAGWSAPPPAGRARGIAVAESFGSYVAQVAEVSLENERPRVRRVVIAADVGTVVNPNQVAAQMEGAMVYGLSAALYGEITLKDGKVEQANFNDYPVLRMNEMPAVEVHLVKSSETPGGVGEPGTPPIAPAVANALFALTGKRLRRLPLAKQV
ncbi:MAG TPA: xanthine dehydrogenase family protein molybdopterin-binding subunit [Burkholderiales bacterium]|nr:xanthine dehydrogenase family protein molybdopterin-binding subunit [Burkholderiales bacterium]